MVLKINEMIIGQGIEGVDDGVLNANLEQFRGLAILFNVNTALLTIALLQLELV